MGSGAYREGITLKKEWETYSHETQKKEVKIQGKYIYIEANDREPDKIHII